MNFRILFVLVVLVPHRRRVIHYNVTAHPISEWAAVCSMIVRSLSGSMPKDVLELPIFGTICLLSSSLTIHLAMRAMRQLPYPLM